MGVEPTADAINKRDIFLLGSLVKEGWEIKKTLSHAVLTELVTETIEVGRRAGALGWKLLGAGGSGFILFVGPQELGSKLKLMFGANYLQPKVDSLGSTVIYSSSEV